MKIIVLSDSHGSREALVEAVKIQQPDMILHLGDYTRDCRVLEKAFPDMMLRAVRGNGDLGAIEPDSGEFTAEGRRIFMTHGHLYHVKTGLQSLINNGMLRRADIVLFGHTHRPYQKDHDGMLVINPGSIGMGAQTYAVLDLRRGAVNCTIMRLD